MQIPDTYLYKCDAHGTEEMRVQCLKADVAKLYAIKAKINKLPPLGEGVELEDHKGGEAKEEHHDVMTHQKAMNIVFPVLAFFVLCICAWFCFCKSSGGHFLRRGKKKIVCVGDSITHGTESAMCYPSILRKMLDSRYYTVINKGVSGTTALKAGDMPYWNETAYQMVLKSNADIIILQLGTNDAKSHNWNEDQFVEDMTEMINNFKELESKPKIYLMVPPPLYEDGAYDMQQSVINTDLPQLVSRIASNTEIPED